MLPFTGGTTGAKRSGVETSHLYFTATMYYVYIIANKYNTVFYIWVTIAREKQLKWWNRNKKISLIKTINPELDELLYLAWDVSTALQSAQHDERDEKKFITL